MCWLVNVETFVVLSKTHDQAPREPDNAQQGLRLPLCIDVMQYLGEIDSGSAQKQARDGRLEMFRGRVVKMLASKKIDNVLGEER